MEIGLKHLFYAFAVLWTIHLGYLLSISFRQKALGEELRSLREAVGRKSAD